MKINISKYERMVKLWQTIKRKLARFDQFGNKILNFRRIAVRLEWLFEASGLLNHQSAVNICAFMKDTSALPLDLSAAEFCQRLGALDLTTTALLRHL